MNLYKKSSFCFMPHKKKKILGLKLFAQKVDNFVFLISVNSIVLTSGNVSYCLGGETSVVLSKMLSGSEHNYTDT